MLWFVSEEETMKVPDKHCSEGIASTLASSVAVKIPNFQTQLLL